jgi:hypothetical protein
MIVASPDNCTIGIDINAKIFIEYGYAANVTHWVIRVSTFGRTSRQILFGDGVTSSFQLGTGGYIH